MASELMRVFHNSFDLIRSHFSDLGVFLGRDMVARLNYSRFEIVERRSGDPGVRSWSWWPLVIGN